MMKVQPPARSATSGGWSTGCAGEASCSDLLQRITAARGAINGLMAEVLEEHVREYLAPTDVDADPLKADAAEELIEIIHSYLT